MTREEAVQEMATKTAAISDKYDIKFIEEIRDQFAASPQVFYTKKQLVATFDALAKMMQAHVDGQSIGDAFRGLEDLPKTTCDEKGHDYNSSSRNADGGWSTDCKRCTMLTYSDEPLGSVG